MSRDISHQTTCPACSSWRVACVVGTDLDMCFSCLKAWERVGPGQAFMVDGEVLPFTVPCENCAFRGKSEERLNKRRWRELQQSLAGGGEFYCHKGVPLKASIKEIADGARDARLAFEFPEETKHIDIEDSRHPYPVYIRSQMRLCRGYLNRFIAPLLRA